MRSTFIILSRYSIIHEVYQILVTKQNLQDDVTRSAIKGIHVNQCTCHEEKTKTIHIYHSRLSFLLAHATLVDKKSI